MAAMVTRRRLVQIAGFAAICPKMSGAPAARVDGLEVISRQPNYFHGWPTLARRRNGELVVAYSGGREGHVCPFGRVEILRSSDDGRTWSWPQVVLDTPIDDRDAGVLETVKGTVLVTTFTSLAYEAPLRAATDWDAPRLERWNAVQRATSPEQRRALIGSWVLRSMDGGLTWSAPQRAPLTNPHGPVNLSDGRLLWAGKSYPGAGDRIGVCESRDDGQTWSWLGTIPARPGDNPVEYHELHVVDAGNGRLIAQIRNHNKANDRETLQTESADGGKTWSVPHETGVWGLPSHLLRLRDGRLLMSYSYRRAPRGNHVRVSEDQGKTWSEPVVLSRDGTGDLGYPSTVELANGSLYTVWYEVIASNSASATERRAVLRAARWSLG